MYIRIKNLIKKILYATGILGLIHHFYNRNVLTVVLFHRVLPAADNRWNSADLEWTVDTNFFKECLQLFKKHYNFVTLHQLQDAVKNGKELPVCPILITFDDGWSDNEEFAANIVKEFKIKPLLFVTINAIDAIFLSWREALFTLWKMDILSNKIIKKIIEYADLNPDLMEWDWKSESSVRHLQAELRKLGFEKSLEITKMVSEFASRELSLKNQMLTKNQLKILSESVMDIGAHGLNHEPITKSPDPAGEFLDAKKQLKAFVNLPYTVSSFSLPHGKYNKSLINLAIKCGYNLIFGSWDHLNSLPLTRPAAVLGRCNINQLGFSDDNGSLAKERLFFHLIRRPRKNLEF